MVYKRLERFLIQLDAVDSTNTYAANLIKTSNVISGTVVLSNEQLSGKGQRSNVWTSQAGKNLTMSLIFSASVKTVHSFYLNVATSLAVRKTLEDLGITAQIKWPNDILVDQKKICGILIENQVSGSTLNSSIIGIGLNVNQRSFDAEVKKATSIALQLDTELEVHDVFEQLYGYLDFYLNLLCESNFALLKKHYYSHLFLLGETASFQDSEGIFEGVIQGITEEGFLEIKKNELKRAYDIKEVSYC